MSAPRRLCFSRRSKGSTNSSSRLTIPWWTWKEPWREKSVWAMNWMNSQWACSTGSYLRLGGNWRLKRRKSWERGWITSRREPSNTKAGSTSENPRSSGCLDCTSRKAIWQLWSRPPAEPKPGHWIRVPCTPSSARSRTLMKLRRSPNMAASLGACISRGRIGISRITAWRGKRRSSSSTRCPCSRSFPLKRTN